MRLVRRFIGVVVLLLSAAGVLCSVAGAIGVWFCCQHTAQRVQEVASRLDVGLERAVVASQNAQSAVEKARAEVARVGKESTDLGGGAEKSRGASRALRTLIQQHVGPNLNDLSGRLATLSDAAVAVSTLLKSFQQLPAGRTGRIKPDQLERWGDEAQQLSGTLRRLVAVVDDGEKATTSKEFASATSEVDLILEKCQSRVDVWQSELEAAREELRHVEAEILGWLTPVAIAVTLLCLWLAASQISLFAHALRWCRSP
jgi:hypothetical protein